MLDSDFTVIVVLVVVVVVDDMTGARLGAEEVGTSGSEVAILFHLFFFSNDIDFILPKYLTQDLFL